MLMDPTQSQSLYYAQMLAENGFYVFPVQRGSKFPFAGKTMEELGYAYGWRDYSTTDMDTIQQWGVQFPGCRFGIDGGKSGLFIVDVDTKAGKVGQDTIELLAADHGAPPVTYTVRTPSGGYHLYYAGRGSNSGLGKDVDVRSNGGYVVAPDGIDYQILNAAPIAQVPNWMMDINGGANSKSDHHADVVHQGGDNDIALAAAYLVNEAPKPQEGERDMATFKVVAKLRSDFGLSYAQAQLLLNDVWLPLCTTAGDWSPSDIKVKLDSAYSGNAGSGQGERHAAAAFAHIETDNGWQVLKNWNRPQEQLPVRRWVLGRWFLRKFLTVTVAPGGTGKSNLSVVEALAIITGLPLTGVKSHEQGNVWIHNGEDPLDELELRVAACCQAHGIDPSEVGSKLHCTSGRTDPIILVREHNRKPYRDENVIAQIKRYITENNIIQWVIDPFADMHEVSENDNMAINMVAKTLSHIADETGCSIHVVHHTRKKGKDGALTDMDMGRGASALMSAARIGRNLNGMSDTDAKKFHLSRPHNWYVRLDSSKANLSSPSDRTEWFEKVSIKLGNGEPVGSLKPTNPNPVEKEDKDAQLRDRIVCLVDERGGAVGVNEAAQFFEAEGYLGIKRSTLYDKIKKVMHDPYDFNGVWYKLMAPLKGARDGWSVMRIDPNVDL